MMKTILKTAALALLGLSLAGTAFARPTSIPKEGKLEFEIVRNGSTIGDHVYDFREIDGKIEVAIRTDIDFNLLFIPVYSFKHESYEVWDNGRLVSMISNTDDNGETKRLDVQPDGEYLMVVNSEGTLHVDREIIPASLWNAAIISRDKTLSTVKGGVSTFDIQYVRDEVVESRGLLVPTRLFRTVGEFERELWYDQENDVLERVRFKASDGSTIEYVRQ